MKDFTKLTKEERLEILKDNSFVVVNIHLISMSQIRYLAKETYQNEDGLYYDTYIIHKTYRKDDILFSPSGLYIYPHCVNIMSLSGTWPKVDAKRLLHWIETGEDF